MATKLTEARQVGEADEIPVIDLRPYLSGEPGALEKAAAELDHACRDVGFFFISNHGVPQSLIDRVFVESKRFHDLPFDQKIALKINKDNRGYMPIGGTTLKTSTVNRNTKPSLNASFFLGRDLAPDHPDVLAKKPFRSPNLWPDGMPNFRSTLVDYIQAVEKLSMDLLPLYSTALGMGRDYFSTHAAFKDPQVGIRLLEYPAQDVIEDNQFGAAPHCDYGFLTILAQANMPGLELQTKSGEWIAAPALPGTFLVNTGDFCMRWSNGRFVSTPHRVVHKARETRYSVAFFFSTNPDVEIGCLPTCQSSDNPPKYPAMTYGAYYRAAINANYHHQSEDAAKAS